MKVHWKATTGKRVLSCSTYAASGLSRRERDGTRKPEGNMKFRVQKDGTAERDFLQKIGFKERDIHMALQTSPWNL